MNDQEALELEIERQAFLITAIELSKSNFCIDTGLCDFVTSLRNKAQNIENRLRADGRVVKSTPKFYKSNWF